MTADGPALTAAAAAVIERATSRGATLATAESCTGGLVAHLLTQVPGASQAFLGGWVVYSDHLKRAQLGVDENLLKRDGAVSRAVAEVMAQSARTRTGATYAVSTTGIAGPGGGTAEKAVGTCWVALAGPDGVEAHHLATRQDDRTTNKQLFAARALQAVLAALEAHDQ